MNTAELIHSQQTLIDKGATYLGDLVAWSICAETRLSEVKIQELADLVGLDRGYLPDSCSDLQY